MIERLQLLVIPLDIEQWGKMRASEKWYPVSSIYERLRQLRQIPDWYTEDKMAELFAEYHEQKIQYQTMIKEGKTYVRAYRWPKERKY